MLKRYCATQPSYYNDYLASGRRGTNTTKKEIAWVKYLDTPEKIARSITRSTIIIIEIPEQWEYLLQHIRNYRIRVSQIIIKCPGITTGFARFYYLRNLTLFEPRHSILRYMPKYMYAFEYPRPELRYHHIGRSTTCTDINSNYPAIKLPNNLIDRTSNREYNELSTMRKMLVGYKIYRDYRQNMYKNKTLATKYY